MTQQMIDAAIRELLLQLHKRYPSVDGFEAVEALKRLAEAESLNIDFPQRDFED